MSKLEIFIARHGQDEDNAAGILNGHRDSPLTVVGREHAKLLAESIAQLGLCFDKIYTSPLRRAAETAQIVATSLALPAPTELDLLIERDFGVMSGERVADIERICAPNIIKTQVVTYFLEPAGAETFPNLLARAHQLLDYVHTQHTSGRVLLVGHGSMGLMVYAAAMGKDWPSAIQELHFGNGELIDISDVLGAHHIKLPQFNH